jgi:hypothetical protein
MVKQLKLQQITHATDRRHEYTHFTRIHLERNRFQPLAPKRGKSDLRKPVWSGKKETGRFRFQGGDPILRFTPVLLENPPDHGVKPWFFPPGWLAPPPPTL